MSPSPPTAGVEVLLKRADAAFLAARQALAEKKLAEVDNILTAIDKTLDDAGWAFRRHDNNEGEQLLFDAKRSIRRIAGLQHHTEQAEIERLLADARAQMDAAMLALNEMIANTNAVAEKVLRKASRKLLIVEEEPPVVVPPRPAETPGLRLAWLVAVVSSMITVILLWRSK